MIDATREYRTRLGDTARVQMHEWRRSEFAYLGTIDLGGEVFGWAWHADGRSIDRDDRGFDLMDFRP